MRRDGKHIAKQTPGKLLPITLKRLKLDRPGLGWYEATRHTFASQWVMSGGSIEKLKEMLGHYSVVVTERYTHLRTDLFADRDRSAMAIDLRAGAPNPVPLGAKTGTDHPAPRRKSR